MAKQNAEIVLQCSTVYPFRLRGQALLCVYCSEGYEDPMHFRRHVDCHHKKFSISAAFAHIGKRKDFLKVDCTNLACRLCTEPFSNIKDVAEHLVKEHNRKLNLDYEIALQTYRLEKGKWFCLLCDERQPTLTNLCRHMTTVHYQKYTCDICGRTYMTIEALRYHVRCSHSGKFVCRKCWQDFPTLEERREHQKLSSRCWTYSCIYCGERFQSWESKTKHLVEKHDIPEVKYSCSECDRTFESRKTFNHHFRKMHTDKGYNCSCGLEFTSQSELRRHRLICAGKQPHKCSVCSKAFAKKVYLTQHMWIHNDVKRFACKPCNKQFNQKISYKIHMKVHHPNVLE